MAKTKPKPEQPKIINPNCTVIVTRAGDGRISNGKHIAGEGDEFFEKGEKFECAASVGYDLEDRHFVEIQDPRPPRPAKAREVLGEPEQPGEWQG